jgi:hypothetical protein
MVLIEVPPPPPPCAPVQLPAAVAAVPPPDPPPPTTVTLTRFSPAGLVHVPLAVNTWLLRYSPFEFCSRRHLLEVASYRRIAVSLGLTWRFALPGR